MKRSKPLKRTAMERKPATKNKVRGLAAEYKREFPYDEWYDEFPEIQQYIGRADGIERGIGDEPHLE